MFLLKSKRVLASALFTLWAGMVHAQADIVASHDLISSLNETGESVHVLTVEFANLGSDGVYQLEVMEILPSLARGAAYQTEFVGADLAPGASVSTDWSVGAQTLDETLATPETMTIRATAIDSAGERVELVITSQQK